MNVLVGLALVIVFVLSGVACYYSYLWKVRKREIEEHRQKELDLIREKQRDAENSITLIARALLQEQCSATEASLRITHLTRSLILDESQSEVLHTFIKLAEEAAHIPILEEWKKLSRKEQRQFDAVRLSLEEKYKDFTRASAEKVIEEPFFQPTSV